MTNPILQTSIQIYIYLFFLLFGEQFTPSGYNLTSTLTEKMRMSYELLSNLVLRISISTLVRLPKTARNWWRIFRKLWKAARNLIQFLIWRWILFTSNTIAWGKLVSKCLESLRKLRSSANSDRPAAFPQTLPRHFGRFWNLKSF